MRSTQSMDGKISLLSPGFWFFMIVTLVCAWVLTLPLFPSQDGPMHRYYVHVLDTLFQHKSLYSAAYQIRHPFPPYATHYLLLLGLSHIFSFDVAEKVFVCLTLICFTVGLRLTACAVGPAGKWTSLFCAPLLLSWPLMMGFFNYVLGLSLVLLAIGFWQRSRNGHRLSILSYLLALLVLTFTHPVPLLLLITIAGLDLILNAWFRHQALTLKGWFRKEASRLFMFACTVLAFGFPALAIDHSAASTAETLSDTGFKPEFFRTTLLLTGMSPYNTRSHNIWINGYRLCLYAILVVALWAGGKASVRALKARLPNIGSTIFIAALILAVVLPFVPNSVNGSIYFETRLVLIFWPSVLIAAAVASAPKPGARNRYILLALISLMLTLVPAEIFFRPLAAQLRTAEFIALPEHQQGIVLLGNGLLDYTRFRKQVAFDPYEWGSILPAVNKAELVLDAPWLDLKITPLMPSPGSPVLLQDISVTHASKTDPPLVKGRSLPGRYEAEMAQKASFILYAGAPDELSRGLLNQLSPVEAAKYICTQKQDWYLICLSKH